MRSLKVTENLREVNLRKQQPLCLGVSAAEISSGHHRAAVKSVRSAAGSSNGPNAQRLSSVMCEAQASSNSCGTIERTQLAEVECMPTDYSIKEVLGSGQQGVVRRAVEAATGKEFAVKLVPKGAACNSNPLALKRLRAEAPMMACLEHCPYVAHLQDSFEDNDHVYIVMELLRGGSLQEKIAEGHLCENGARHLMHGVLSFLEACHDKGIAYGDVKPANFMLTGDEEPQVKAIDFGCSQKVIPGLHLRARVGSPAFMAPEVHLGAYGVEADMWSAGVVLYQLLSGNLPFVRMEDGEIAEIGIHLGFSFDGEEWSSVSQEAKDLVTALLVRNRRDRSTAGEALASSWFAQLTQTSSSVVEFSFPKSGSQSLSTAS